MSSPASRLPPAIPRGAPPAPPAGGPSRPLPPPLATPSPPARSYPNTPLPPLPRTQPPPPPERPLPPTPSGNTPPTPPSRAVDSRPTVALPRSTKAGALPVPNLPSTASTLCPISSLANRSIISPRYAGGSGGGPPLPPRDEATSSGAAPTGPRPGKLVVPPVFASLRLQAPATPPSTSGTSSSSVSTTESAGLKMPVVDVVASEPPDTQPAPPSKERPLPDLVLPSIPTQSLAPPLVQQLALSPRVAPSTPGLPELSLLPSMPGPDLERRATRRRKSFLNLLGKEDINPAFEQSDVFYKGYLYKKKIKTQRTICTSTWKRRYFVLKRAGLLFYYTSQTATSPLGFMDVNAAQIQNEFFYENKFVWEIHGRSDSYMIASETQQEKDGWVSAFRAFAPAALPPPPPPAPISNTILSPSPPSNSSTPATSQPAPPSSSSSSSSSASSTIAPDPNRKDMRAEVMKEMVETERAYIKDLNTVILLYKNNPLFTDFLNGPADVAILFSNIEVIVSVNVLLLEKLEQLYTLPLHEQNVGAVFLDMASAMKVYITYCSNHPTASQRIQELRKNVPGAVEFLDKMRMHPMSNRLELESMLIKPLQRICKYPLLLRELIKSTPENHKYYAELKQAMEKLEELLMYLNEKKRESEALARLVRIHNSLVWKEEPLQLVMPSRKLLLKGKFARMYRDEKFTKAWTGSVMLFNDMVLVTKKLAPKKHQCMTAIPLNLLLLWADASSPCNFVVLHTDKRAKYTILTASAQERKTWEDSINDAINNAEYSRNRVMTRHT